MTTHDIANKLLADSPLSIQDGDNFILSVLETSVALILERDKLRDDLHTALGFIDPSYLDPNRYTEYRALADRYTQTN